MDGSLVNQIVLALSTLLASLGGFVLAGINERRRDERVVRRDLALQASERDARLAEAEHTMQLETLLALQDALQIMTRLTGKAMHFDHMQARRGQYTQLPDGLSDEMHANGVEVRRLTTRVLNEEIRETVARFTSTGVRLSLSPADLKGLAGDELERRFLAKTVEFNDVYEELSQIVGNAVRNEIAWRPSLTYRKQPHYLV